MDLVRKDLENIQTTETTVNLREAFSWITCLKKRSRTLEISILEKYIIICDLNSSVTDLKVAFTNFMLLILKHWGKIWMTIYSIHNQIKMYRANVP